MKIERTDSVEKLLKEPWIAGSIGLGVVDYITKLEKDNERLMNEKHNLQQELYELNKKLVLANEGAENTKTLNTEGERDA